MRPVPRKLARLARCIPAGLILVLVVIARPVAAQTTVGGVVYAHYLYQLSDSANHLNNFDVARAYVNVTARLSGGIATRVTSDVYRNTDGSLALRLKYAYVTYTPSGSALTFKFGQMHTPWVDWEEGLWGYRMQGTIALDRAGYLSSSDFGAGVDGHWGGERVNAQVGFYNGETYNKAPGDQRKDVMARASYRLLGTDDDSRRGGVRVSGYAQFGKPTTGGQRRRFVGMLSYQSQLLTLAAELASTRDSTTGTGPGSVVPSRAGRVISAYGVLRWPGRPWAAIARVDQVDPNTSVAADATTRIIAGISYQLSPNVRLLADVDRVGYQSGHTVTPAEQAVRTMGLMQVQFTF